MRLSRGMGGFIVLFFMCAMVFAQESRLDKLTQKVLKQQEMMRKLNKQLEKQEEIIQKYSIDLDQTTETKVDTKEYDQEAEKYIQEVVDTYKKEGNANNTEGLKAYYEKGKGFCIESPDNDLKIIMCGYLMVDVGFTEAHAVQNNSFSLRRNRAIMQVLYKDWKAFLQFAYENSNPNGTVGAQVTDYFIEYTGIPYLKPRIGNFIVPFSMEFATSVKSVLTISYSPYILSAPTMPLRESGVMIHGYGIPFLRGDFTSDYLWYAVGMFNSDGAKRFSLDDDVMGVATLKFFPFTRKNGYQNTHIQISGFFTDSDHRQNSSRIRLDGLQLHEVFANGTFDNTNGQQIGVTASYRYWKDNLRIEGEFAFIEMDRKVDHENGLIAQDLQPLQLWSFYTAISYFIELGDQKKNPGMGIEPLFKFSYTSVEDRKGDGSNFASADPLGTLTDMKGQDVWEIVFGLRFHVSKHARIDFNWTMYDLEVTEGFTNSDRGRGGGMMHSFLFQFLLGW